MPSVVVSGLGFITSIGNEARQVASSLREGHCGIERWTGGVEVELPIHVAGTLKGFDLEGVESSGWTWPGEFDLDPVLVRGLPPHGVYAACAVEQALAAAGLSRDVIDDGQTGLYCASTGSPRLTRHHVEKLESTGWRRGHPLAIVRSAAGTLNFNFGAHYRIRGATCGFVSACTSSSHALGHAIDEIRLGRQRRMIVVGAEDLGVETLLPFHPMGALSLNPDPETASRPFDRGHDGFVGTGGAVAMIIEDEAACLGRGVRPQARVTGWGQAADGFSVAAPHPDGAGIRAAMQRALDDAGLAPPDIDYVNAHATSTAAGDRAEALAIAAVFGDHRPHVSSTKALTGHGLSCAGVMEAAFCVLALDGGFVPAQFHLENPIPEAENLSLPRRSPVTNPRHVLNNSSGFGGSNVCHVFTRYDD
jgi:3-oxoacyl-[acyl-carrier-protein] synthase-1